MIYPVNFLRNPACFFRWLFMVGLIYQYVFSGAPNSGTTNLAGALTTAGISKSVYDKIDSMGVTIGEYH